MTTKWTTVRPVAAPVLLLGGAAVFLLTNDTPSSQAARSAAGAVADWPTWGQHALAGASEGGLVLLALLLAASAWQARARGPRSVATAVVGGAGVLVALVVSELAKVLVAQDRPCRAVPGLDAIAECPPVGDWSLPSNHATLAAALAAALIWTIFRWWPIATLLALAVAAARVGLGVHYPHDVMDGLVLGAVVVSLLVFLLRGPATRLVTTVSGVPLLGSLLATEPRRPIGSRRRGDA
ncbi:phosphatase PAP2 family protein [Blastococcus sp. VKM Ac-2987]|uniref:phosphatase PAP2 family protein n=1 Tax=Blastococcus sp. VKM Ac-2987 TaxID=3004141 RepID=UPI0022AB91AB|nr:phosphatase PAP2 family protein [Blastococcus sp. VKM Ac-2987]MCZ2860850.1 phosphatase PAP2 family protein [Blastococcus sp. VKM Ac-2987]